MIRSITGKIVTVLTLILLSTMMGAQRGMAQDNGFQRVTVQVSLNIGGKEKFQTVQYAKFKTYRQALNAQNELKVALTKMDQPGSMGDELDKAVKKLNIVWQISSANGIFKTSVMPGQGILILAENTVTHSFEIKEGKTDYREQIKIERQLREVDVLGTNRRTQPTMSKMPSLDTGYETRFDIKLELPEGYTTDNSRLIIQPMAIDCQTEDTMAYLTPYVFEGERYHKLQDRRMAFDYPTNDSLARGYVSDNVLQSNKPFSFHTTAVYRKPDKDKIYRGAYTCVLEDYHHVAWDGGEETGSCLSFRPFKFLDFSVTAAEMPLTSEFQEAAEANMANIARDLKLKFKQGQDVLLDDSINQIETEKLIKELRSYGSLLWQVQVQGGASAEGSQEINIKLAKMRTAKALSMLRGRVASDARLVTLPPRVYTWDDVATEVEKKGNAEMTDMVKNAITNNKPNEVYGILKSFPFFETTIEPILESQRMMRCVYTYELEHVMEADEAVAAYYANKADYLSGKKHLSNGDYFNLFATIKDSVELDTVTMLAYKHITSQAGYINLKLAPYVANRMALMNIRRGTPNPEILRPFIDYSVKNVNQKWRVDDYTTRIINREEILINQAVCYFQEQKLDTAMYIINWVPESERTNKLRMFINFSRDYTRYICGEITDPAELEKVKQAELFVLNSNPDNRAIIYSELHNHLNKTRRDAEYWVDRMSDDNPKKWYLKGILWSEEAGKEPPVEGVDDGFRELSDVELMELQNSDPAKLAAYYEAQEKHMADIAASRQDNTPYFLAYFQHSFDLEPKYKRLFYNEGNVSDDIRKKFKYTKKNIPAYRKKFKALKAQADRLKALQPAEETPADNQETNNQETENTQVENTQAENN